MDYYTYAYLREDRTPYYIGKGTGRRIYSTKRKVKAPKDKSRIIFLKQNLSEEEAFKHEEYMIAVFGRKDNGTGILRNLTDGGEGASNQGTPEQRSEAARKRMANMTLERRKEASKKRLANMPPGKLSESLKKAHGRKTPEQRSEAARKRMANMTLERRKEIARKRIANMTPEKRSEIARKGNASRTPEQRSEVARKARATMTSEQRSEAARKGRATMTSEQRSKQGKKAWETRRANRTPEQLNEEAEKIRKALSQKWQCTVTGYITNAGNLSQYQRRRGIDTSKRIKLPYVPQHENP
jgi:hypothetical protein